MRWIRYETNGQTAYGIVDGDMVTEVRGDPFAGYEKTATRRPLSSVKLLVPVEPRTFYAAGLNYAEHAIAAANKRGEVPKLPEAADIGYRANNALIAHGESIVIPADATERVQYEAELVAVIGRKALYLNPVRIESIIGVEDDEALDLVAQLMTHATQKKFEYRHQWRYGDMVIWDNRSVLHKANPDYDMNERRYLYRLMLKGEVPV